MCRTSLLDNWIPLHHPRAQACIRLFCLPYAGGGASIFTSWPKYMPTEIDVCPIQIPGRENRINEVPYTNVNLLVEAIALALLPALDKRFAFFGHSMGALIAFELIRYLRRHSMPQPVHLFASGEEAPQIPNPDPPKHQLPEKEFIEEIRHFNGTPEEVLKHEELMEILLPCLRADFELCENYIYHSENPLSVPVTVFGGWQDDGVSIYELKAWQDQTLETCDMYMFPGAHFFLNSSREQMLRYISDKLKPWFLTRL